MFLQTSFQRASLVLLPLLLAGCIFDEIESNAYDIVFQSDGTVQFSNSVVGSAANDLREMDQAEVNDFADHFRGELREGMDELFEGHATDVAADFSDLSRISVDVAGVFPRFPTVDLNEMSRQFVVHPSVGAPDMWAVVMHHNSARDWPVNVCITLSSEWTVLEQGVVFPQIASGARTCADWTEIQINPVDAVAVRYTEPG